MFAKTAANAPWKIINANIKAKARLEALEYILENIPYQVKDPEVIRYEELDL